VYLLRKCKYVLIDVIKRTPRQLKKLVKSGFTPEVAEYVQINFVLKFFKIMEMQGYSKFKTTKHVTDLQFRLSRLLQFRIIYF
jgi:hypothetical protein